VIKKSQVYMYIEIIGKFSLYVCRLPRKATGQSLGCGSAARARAMRLRTCLIRKVLERVSITAGAHALRVGSASRRAESHVSA